MAKRQAEISKPVAAIIALGALAMAVDRFYQHPTYGRGVQALWAALQAGEAL